jgi:hypothetical protein
MELARGKVNIEFMGIVNQFSLSYTSHAVSKPPLLLRR